jgi:hypothetical protein
MTTDTKNKVTWEITIDLTTFDWVNDGVQMGMIEMAQEGLMNYLKDRGVTAQLNQGSVGPKRGA